MALETYAYGFVFHMYEGDIPMVIHKQFWSKIYLIRSWFPQLYNNKWFHRKREII